VSRRHCRVGFRSRAHSPAEIQRRRRAQQTSFPYACRFALYESLVDDHIRRGTCQLASLPRLICFRIGLKLCCIRSTPTEIQWTSENDFECLANAVRNRAATKRRTPGRGAVRGRWRSLPARTDMGVRRRNVSKGKRILWRILVDRLRYRDRWRSLSRRAGFVGRRGTLSSGRTWDSGTDYGYRSGILSMISRANRLMFPYGNNRLIFRPRRIDNIPVR